MARPKTGTTGNKVTPKAISLHRALLRKPGGDAGHAVQVILNNSRDLAPFPGTCPDHFAERTGIGTAGNSMWPADS